MNGNSTKVSIMNFFFPKKSLKEMKVCRNFEFLDTELMQN